MFNVGVIDSRVASSIGQELVTNGSFSADTSWSYDAPPFSISGGRLVYNSDTGDISRASQYITYGLQPAGIYRVEFTVVNALLNGRVYVSLGFAAGIARNSAGTYAQDIVQSSSFDLIAVNCYGGDAGFVSIDNLSVKKIN